MMHQVEQRGAMQPARNINCAPLPYRIVDTGGVPKPARNRDIGKRNQRLRVVCEMSFNRLAPFRHRQHMDADATLA